jgi:hypothetical protein
MSSVYCRFLTHQCYDYIGKCFNCKIRKKALENEVETS